MSTSLKFSESAKNFAGSLFTFKKLKALPRHQLIFWLTMFASLILGLLSFGGLMALFPILSLGFLAFGLAVVYEGEIYFKNIQNAFKKLFISRFLKKTIAMDLLYDIILEADKKADCPQFFKDYQITVEKILHNRALIAAINEELAALKTSKLQENLLDNKNKLKMQIRQWEAQLKNMEKFFAKKAYSYTLPENTAYQKELALWLAKHQYDARLDEDLSKRRTQFFITAGFALISGAFMAWGTIFMLTSTLAAIPLLAGLATMPWLVIPLALIAGIAWSFLVYNAITDIIIQKTAEKFYNKTKAFLKSHHELLLFVAGLFTIPWFVLPATLVAVIIWKSLSHMNDKEALPVNSWQKSWFESLNRRFTGQLSPKAIFTFFFGATLVGLTITLSSFLAATLFSTGTEPMQILNIFSGTFQYVAAILMAITIGISELFFAFQNTIHSVKDLRQSIKDLRQSMKKHGQKSDIILHFFQEVADNLSKNFRHLLATENWLQIINPVRLFIQLTFIPIKIILFSGHLVSIGVGGDKVPGVPNYASAILGFFGELGVDWHYFEFLNGEGHHHHHEDTGIKSILKERLRPKHDHDHGNDLPTRILSLLFIPIYGLAAIWDFSASWIGNGLAKLFDIDDPVKPLSSLNEAYKKQKKKSHSHTHTHIHTHPCQTEDAEPLPLSDLFATEDSDSSEAEVSSGWLYEGLRFRVKRFQDGWHPSKSEEKTKALEAFSQTVLAAEVANVDPGSWHIQGEFQKPLYQEQRFFSLKKTTRTEDFIAKLEKSFCAV